MSAMGIHEVETWKPGGLSADADELSTKVKSFEQDINAVSSRGMRVPDFWEGPAGEAVVEDVGRTKRAGVNGAEALLTVVDALNAGAQDLAAAKERVLSLRDAAQSAGFTVHDDGTVIPPSDTVSAAAIGGSALNPVAMAAQAREQAQKKQQAAEFTRQLRHALALAEEADQRTGHQVSSALAAVHEQAASPDYSGFAAALAGASHDKKISKYLGPNAQPLPSSPAALAALWGGLSAREKEALAAKYPDLGQRDGIPCAERDLFNRAGFDSQLSQMQSQKAALQAKWDGHVPEQYIPGNPTGTWKPNPAYKTYVNDMARVATLAGLIKGANAIKGRLNKKGYYLLGFKPHEGVGQAILAHGDPDTATNVVTFVPGTTASLKGMAGRGGGLSRTDHLYDAMAARAAPGQKPAVVTWYGYNAPQHVLGDAKSPADAQAAVPALDRFQAGLRATHQGSTSFNSVFGHSYAATLISDAASGKHHLDANNVTFMGPSGAGNAHSFKDFHLQSYGHEKPTLYTAVAPGDPIPSLSQGGRQIGIVDDGVNPADPSFGGRSFPAPISTTKEFWDPIATHGSYWDPGSPGLAGQAYIGLNQLDKVPKPPPPPPPIKGPHPWL